MMSSIRSEFRKILTVRSTYLIILFGVLLTGLFAFYGQGIRYGEGGPKDMPIPPVPAGYLQQAVKDAVNALGLFIALVGVLLMSHEYRYNTIMYTLTASNSRSKTLFSKIFATTVVTLLLVLFFGALSPTVTALGLMIKGVDITPQTFYFKDLIWHTLFYGWGFAMMGLLLVVLIRNQIGALVSLLLFPVMVEPLLGIVLRDNIYYLPFMALSAVINTSDKMTDTKGAMVFMVYMVVGWLIAWVLFTKRDAN